MADQEDGHTAALKALSVDLEKLHQSVPNETPRSGFKKLFMQFSADAALAQARTVKTKLTEMEVRASFMDDVVAVVMPYDTEEIETSLMVSLTDKDATVVLSFPRDDDALHAVKKMLHVLKIAAQSMEEARATARDIATKTKH